MIKYACAFCLVAVTGCATNEPEIPRAELREMLRESGATEGLTQEQIDRGCTVWGRKGPVVAGAGQEPGAEGRQLICPEFRVPEDDNDSSQ